MKKIIISVLLLLTFISTGLLITNLHNYYETNKKIEEAVVGGYKKVEDKFVDTFLKKDGETIEEAKERIKEEQKKLEEQNKARVEDALELSKKINDKYVK